MACEVGHRLDVGHVQLTLLRLGGALHDVGKLAVSRTVLNKPGPLTDEELVEVRAHPEIGARMVALEQALRPALPAVLHHHERWDGAGYPAGRRGPAIPLEARILAVADAFDAMTSDRPYRAALPAGAAAEELGRCAGTQFDPEVCRVFLEAWESSAFGAPVSLRLAG